MLGALNIEQIFSPSNFQAGHKYFRNIFYRIFLDQRKVLFLKGCEIKGLAGIFADKKSKLFV